MSDLSNLHERAYRIRRFALRMGEVQGQGYIAQALQPISLGPKPKDLEKIFDATKVIVIIVSRLRHVQGSFERRAGLIQARF